LPLPPGHRFPMAKYARLRERVASELTGVKLEVPEPASDEALHRVHTAHYLSAMRSGSLSAAEQRVLGFPWSPAMHERARRSVGATLHALTCALNDGVAEGYCCFNEFAVAIRHGQHEGTLRRALVLDLDVHQGNGTAAIFDDDPSVFTVSLHGQSNYPFRKTRSDLDIGLPDATSDSEYLAALNKALAVVDEVVTQAGQFDVMFYLAGADVFAGDRLGKLALSAPGVAARDARVFEWVSAQGLPVVVAMGGGYCPDIDQIVAIHFETVRQAALLKRTLR
jgi:acetoin utilization deacetylase AcuC-like enzyme